MKSHVKVYRERKPRRRIRLEWGKYSRRIKPPRASRRRLALIAALLVVAVALLIAFSALPREPAQAPEAAPDGFCEVIRESVEFFQRFGVQETSDSQMRNYERRCR